MTGETTSTTPTTRPAGAPTSAAQWQKVRDLRAAALSAARAGCYVFPVHEDSKIPALHGARSCRGRGVCTDGHQGWEQRATRDEDLIRRWWGGRTGFNVGIACGRSGLVVIDLDDAHGENAPEEWAGARGGADVLGRLAARAGHALNPTMIVATPTGGTHRYYHAPDGVELRCSAGALGWRCDVRAHGGFVVGPHSIRPEGRYTITQPGAPAPLPGWLTQRLAELAPPPIAELPPRAPLGLPDGRAARYLSAIITDETDKVRAARPGRRRATLLTAARTLGRLVGGNELSHDEARAQLLAAAAAHIGVHRFTAAEAEATIDDALRYGMQMPRRVRRGPEHTR